MTALHDKEPPPQEITQERISFESLKRIAFLEGRKSVFGDGATADTFLSRILDQPQSQREILMQAFDDGMRRGRDPNAPRKAADVVSTYVSLYGAVKTKSKLGKSKSYPNLLLMAYALGRDGTPFMFPEPKIANALRINKGTIENFISLMIRDAYLYIVRHGVRGVNGIPAWYRLNLPAVKSELGLDGIYALFDLRISLLMA